MRKIFWENPYQQTLITKVAAVRGNENNEVLLEDTIAYSFSGGQESDTAYINGFRVENSVMEQHLIYYALPSHHNLKPGDEVVMTIDWPRRYRLMRLHFAAELILELVTQHYHLKKVGAHISEHKARIDFIWSQNITTIFAGILAQYNEIIASDRLIQTGYKDLPSQQRYWKIDGFAEVHCGGTHVKSTREVGLVTLKRAHPGKEVERIEIRLAEP